MKLSIKGNQALIKGIRAYEKRSIERTKDELKAWADKTEMDAKRDVPKQSGALQSSIHSTPGNEGLAQTVGTPVDYAPYVEFGTGTKVKIPQGLENYAEQFMSPNRDHNVNLPARPYLFSNARNNFTEMIERLKRRLGS